MRGPPAAASDCASKYLIEELAHARVPDQYHAGLVSGTVDPPRQTRALDASSDTESYDRH